jgi:hypothetical protein
MGRRPINSAMSPNFTRSCGITSAWVCCSLNSDCRGALKPMPLCPARPPMMSLSPAKAPATMNRTFFVSIVSISWFECFRPPPFAL